MSWSTEALGVVATVANGKTPSKAEKRDTGHPVLKIRDVDDLGQFRGVGESFVDSSMAAKFRNKWTSPGDTLILNAAHNADYVGSKAFYVSDDAKDLLATGEWLMVRADTAKLDQKYAHYWLTSVDTKAQIKEAVKGIHLYPKDVARMRIPLPPLREQRRIAAILDQADELRRLRRQASARLEDLGHAIFANLLGQHLSSGGTQRLGEFADLQVGYPFKSKLYSQCRGSFSLCRGANILPDEIDWSDHARYPAELAQQYMNFALTAGDVVLAMDRPWISSGFKVASIRERDLPALLVQRVARLRARNQFDQVFLFYLVRSNQFQRHCRPTETTIPHISPVEIRNFEFNLPSEEKRREFARSMQALSESTQPMQTRTQFLEDLFASLQHRAFLGEL